MLIFLNERECRENAKVLEGGEGPFHERVAVAVLPMG